MTAEAAPRTQEALAFVGATEPVSRCLSDADLLAEGDAWEAMGRLVDARRAAFAAEVAQRSRVQLGEESLAKREGFRTASDLLQQRLRIGVREVTRRTELGKPLAPKLALSGEELPARYPALAAAFQAGEVGTDSARVIVDMLNRTRRRAAPEDLVAAEEALTERARLDSTEILTVHAEVWEARIDPDGPEPNAADQQRKRAWTIGRTQADGMTRSVIWSTPEGTAQLRAMRSAFRRGVQWVSKPAAEGADHGDGEDDEAQWHEARGDERTSKQHDYDVLMGVLAAGMRASQAGAQDAPPLSSPVEVVVQTTAGEVDARRGRGWAVDERAPLAMSTVEMLSCGGAVRLLTTSAEGAPLKLGRTVRLFTDGQKKALLARDGGCTWPGCTAPASWCDAHHVAWWHRDGGPTDVDNGVLLCGFHHTLIHRTKKWEIRVHERMPYLVPMGWQGAPLRRHRMQQHPITRIGPPLRT